MIRWIQPARHGILALVLAVNRDVRAAPLIIVFFIGVVERLHFLALLCAPRADLPQLPHVERARGDVSDHRGEKLSECFVIEAITTACSAAGVQPAFAMLAPRLTGGALHYCLFVENSDINGQPLAEALEAELCENPHYALCRKLGQLGSAGVQGVSGAYEKYCGRLAQSEMRLGDIKPAALSSKTDWSDWLAD